MAKRDKLFDRICNNPKDVRFDDACKAAEWLGFTGKGGKGDHLAFSRPGEPTGLNFQRRTGGKIRPYQAHQLIAMIERYRDERPEEEPNEQSSDAPNEDTQ